MPGRVQHLMRESEAVPNDLALAVVEDADNVLVTMVRERRYRDVDLGTLIGVRVQTSGQVSVMRTLPADSMGSVLDEDLLTKGVNDGLDLIQGLWEVDHADLAIGIELSDTTLVTDGVAADLGHRSQASMRGFGRNDLQLAPDEIVSSDDLFRDHRAVAANAVASLLRAWRVH